MSNAPAVTDEKKLSPVQVFRNQLWSGRDQYRAALPQHIPVDRFVRMTMTVINQSPNLLKCDRLSLQSSLMTAAALGLMPETFLGEAYFIPFGDKVQLQIGYKGLLKLARQSGEIAAIESGVLHENDEYSYEEGDNGHFWVKPNLLADRGKPIAAYCIIRLKSGESQREVMSVYEIEQIRLSSRSKDSPAWKSHWAAMARKVVIKRALKYAPSSTELMQALAVDDAPESGAIVAALPDGQLQIEQAPQEQEQAPRKREKRASTKAVDQLAQHLEQHIPQEERDDPPPPAAELPRGFHDDEEAEEIDYSDYPVGVSQPAG